MQNDLKKKKNNEKDNILLKYRIRIIFKAEIHSNKIFYHHFQVS